MRTRKGFVANSSTSSFLIYGAYVESKEWEKRTGSDDCWVEGLFASYGSEWSEGVYVGKSWSDVGDDETGAEFKVRVQAAIKALLGDDWESFGTYEDAWRDG
jgi:hypothetical protein